MKRISFFLMAMLFSMMSFAETYSLTPDKTQTGLTNTSYITTLTDFEYNGVAWKMNQWNPSSLQVKTNQSSAASEWRFYNTSAMPGKITKVVIKFSALALKSTTTTGFMFVGGSAAVTATTGGTNGVWDATAKTLTWTPSASDNFTYFALYQNGKVATGSNYLAKSDAIVVTYEAAGGSAETIVKTLKSIAVEGMTTTYEQGDIFKFDGTCTATYSVTKNDEPQADETKTVTPAVSVPDMNLLGTQTVTVSYTDDEETVSTTYDINIIENTVTPGTYTGNLNNTFFGCTAGNNGAELSGKFNDILVVASCKESAQNKTYYDAAHVRFYADTYLKISVPEGYAITSIQLKEPTSSTKWDGSISVDKGTYTEGTKSWSGYEQEVQFSFGKQNRIASITVTYELLDVKHIAVPIISGETEFVESSEVSISAEDGLKVYYTLDGTDPTNASTEYTATFTVTATTTVKAVAYDGEKASDIASQTFKKLQVLTCEEAADTCTSTESANKYIIRGYVTNVKYAYNDEYKTATFWIADSKDGGQVLQAYSAKPVAEVDKAVTVGDYVETIGNLKLYNSIPELTNGTYTIIPAPIVTYTVSVASVQPEWGTVTGAGVYEEGEEVTVVATANDDYVFDAWTESGDTQVLSLSRTYTFTVEKDIALDAYFKAIPQAELLSGKFSVAADKLVEFAPGNLQFHTGDSTWRFAKQSYIAIGERNINIGDPEYKGWIDMLGWSTANTYYGVDPSNKNELYVGEFVDWGQLFPGENWYTLSKEEWKYLLNTRENAANLKHLAKIYDLNNKIDTVFGLLLLPDMFERELSSHATLVEEDGVAVYHMTLQGWANLESAGAVFLPAAGRRTGGYGNIINYNQVVETDPEMLVNGGFYRWHDNLNHYCYYWTSTINEEDNVSYLHNIVALGNDEYTYGTGAIWGEKGRYGQSVRLARVTKIIPQIVEWELNGGELPAAEVPTNAELWEAFKPYYNTFYNDTRADRPIEEVSTFAAKVMQKIMTDPESDYKWLGDYILGVAASQGVTLPTDMAAANEGAWRWAVHAFFNAAAGQHGAAGTDFTIFGLPEKWGAAYQAVHELVLPTEPVGEDYTLPTPVKEGYIFDGWYDNAEGEGEPYTVLPAGWVGTLHAIWSKKIVYETVYFVNTAQWETVNAYAWNGNNNNSWPGVALEATGEVILGQTVYSFTAEQGTYTNIIFNNGNDTQKTADLNWVPEEYYVYCSEVWTTHTSVEAVLQRWIGTWTIVGDAALLGVDWDPAYVGYDMQLQENGTLQYVLENTLLLAKTYGYKAAKDHNWDVSVPQNNNQLSINKDGFYNVTFTLNPFTSTLTAGAELLSEYKYIPSVTLVGDMNDWTQKMDIFEISEDSLTASFTVNLEATTYEFKIVLDGTTWMTNVGTMTRDNSFDWPFENLDGENNNAKIEADVAGEYTFTWNYEAKTLSIVYPQSGTTTGVGNNIFVEQPVKIFRDGQVLILKGDKIFNIMGQQVK